MRSVALSEWLRPWHGVGVTAFLSEFPLDISQLSPEFSPSQANRHPSPSGPSQAVGVHGTGQGGRASLGSRGSMPPPKANDATVTDSSAPYVPYVNDAKATQIAGSKDEMSSSSEPVPRSLSPSSATSVSVSSSASRSGPASSESPKGSFLPEPLPREDWPKAFQDYFQKISPSPVLWCYEALGEDLLGTPDQERSQCLKRLIGELHFPKGTSVFWPPSLPDVSDIEQSQGVLLRVFQELFPKLVICLGSGPVLSFLSDGDAPLPFTQRLVKGHMVVFLPDFSEMTQNPSLFNQAVLYLRAIVSQLFIV